MAVTGSGAAKGSTSTAEAKAKADAEAKAKADAEAKAKAAQVAKPVSDAQLIHDDKVAAAQARTAAAKATQPAPAKPVSDAQLIHDDKIAAGQARLHAHVHALAGTSVPATAGTPADVAAAKAKVRGDASTYRPGTPVFTAKLDAKTQKIDGAAKAQGVKADQADQAAKDAQATVADAQRSKVQLQYALDHDLNPHLAINASDRLAAADQKITTSTAVRDRAVVTSTQERKTAVVMQTAADAKKYKIQIAADRTDAAGASTTAGQAYQAFVKTLTPAQVKAGVPKSGDLLGEQQRTALSSDAQRASYDAYALSQMQSQEKAAALTTTQTHATQNLFQGQTYAEDANYASARKSGTALFNQALGQKTQVLQPTLAQLLPGRQNAGQRAELAKQLPGMLAEATQAATTTDAVWDATQSAVKSLAPDVVKARDTVAAARAAGQTSNDAAPTAAEQKVNAADTDLAVKTNYLQTRLTGSAVKTADADLASSQAALSAFDKKAGAQSDPRRAVLVDAVTNASNAVTLANEADTAAQTGFAAVLGYQSASNHPGDRTLATAVNTLGAEADQQNAVLLRDTNTRDIDALQTDLATHPMVSGTADPRVAQLNALVGKSGELRTGVDTATAALDGLNLRSGFAERLPTLKADATADEVNDYLDTRSALYRDTPAALAGLNDAQKADALRTGHDARAEDQGASWTEVAEGAAIALVGGLFMATGAGAVVGGIMVAQGAIMAAHGLTDLHNHESTDSFGAQLLEGAGVSTNISRRVDLGVNAALSLGAGGVGIAKMGLTALKAGELTSTARGWGILTGGAMLGDQAQAAFRNSVLNDQQALAGSAFAVMKGGQALGMDITAQEANEITFAASLALPMAVAHGPRAVSFVKGGGGPAHEPGFTTVSDAGGTRAFDWYGKNAPESVRQQVASVLLPGGDSSALASMTNALAKRSFVVEPSTVAGSEGQFSSAAVLQTGWSGTLGRDFAGKRVGPQTTRISEVGGEDGGVGATTAAVQGVKQFTNQRGVAWDSNTLDAAASAQIPDAKATSHVVSRDAPASMTTAGAGEGGAMPAEVASALYGDGGALPLRQQLRNLDAVPVDQRTAWPTGAQRIAYSVKMPARPVTFLGNETLGAVFHPIQSGRSVVGWVNTRLNVTRWAVDGYRAVRDRVTTRSAGAPSDGGTPPTRQLRPAWAFADLAVRQARNSAGDLVRPVARGISAAGDVVRPVFSAVNSRVNPYAASGIEPGAARAFARNVGYAARYGSQQLWGVTRPTMLAATVPQLATGHFTIAENDNRYLSPWNVSTSNLGRRSITVDFPLTGTRFSAWIGGPNFREPNLPIDAPFVDRENGSMPLGRFGAPPSDPSGPKSFRFISLFRSVIADSGIGVRWFGNNEAYATSSISSNIGSAALSFSGEAPAERGANKGLSALGAFTSWLPQVSDGFFIGALGYSTRDRRTMPAFTVQTSPVSAGAARRAILSGKYYVVGTDKAGPSTGNFWTLSASHGKADIRDPNQPQLVFGSDGVKVPDTAIPLDAPSALDAPSLLTPPGLDIPDSARRPPRNDLPVDVVVDGNTPGRGTLSAIARTVAEKDHIDFGRALARIYDLNPQYDRTRMDGRLTAVPPWDPDLLHNGDLVRVA